MSSTVSHYVYCIALVVDDWLKHEILTAGLHYRKDVSEGSI